jgi:F0F1-type ATP synthase membrane subunit b/b'
MEKYRGWVRSRPILWSVGIFLVALIIGGAIMGSSNSNLEDEKSKLEGQVANAQAERDEAEGATEEAKAEAQDVKKERGRIISAADAEAEKIVGNAKAEANELQSVSAEVESAKSELAHVEDSINGAEEVAAKSVIPGNGTFRAEVDFVPGTYESSGGSNCYWATLNSADPYDIASNENASGQTIASIHTPYFQTDGCSKWKRIGE